MARPERGFGVVINCEGDSLYITGTLRQDGTEDWSGLLDGSPLSSAHLGSKIRGLILTVLAKRKAARKGSAPELPAGQAMAEGGDVGADVVSKEEG